MINKILTFIVLLPERIIGILIWLILQPYKIIIDFKDNMQMYELAGRKVVHGNAKGTEMYKNKFKSKINNSVSDSDSDSDSVNNKLI